MAPKVGGGELVLLVLVPDAPLDKPPAAPALPDEILLFTVLPAGIPGMLAPPPFPAQPARLVMQNNRLAIV
jgi:hypothetical protein